MKYLIFKNAGEINPKSITTFGVNVKENTNAIGYFGTGLKYAIAILLRNKQTIQIMSGIKTYDFTVGNTKIREKDFTFVKMNKRHLSFTTELGKTWLLWQAFRELYCNCLDENGECFLSNTLPEPEKGKTYIITSGKEIVDLFYQKHEIVLDSQILFKNKSGEIHPGKSKWIYYRGIKAYELDTPTLYTYNILSPLELTEDRTIKYSWYIGRIISDIVSECNISDICTNIVDCADSFYEHVLSYSMVEYVSVEFLEAARTLVTVKKTQINPSLISVLNNNGIKIELYSPIKLNKIQEQVLTKSIEFCKKLGYEIDKYPIICTSSLGPGVLGLADNGTIYISERTFMQGSKIVTGTLLEEFLHLEYGLKDCDRVMQNFLFDTIITLGELILCEPL